MISDRGARFLHEHRLVVAITSLLVLVIGGFSWAAYVQVRGETRRAAERHVADVAPQLAGALLAGLPQRITEVQAARAAPNPAALTALTVRDSLNQAAELWDSTGGRVLTAGRALPSLTPAAARALMELLHGNPVGLGPLRLVDSAVFFPIIGAAVAQGQVVVVWRRVSSSPEATRRITELIGSDAALYVGNVSGDLWTDLARPVVGPPLAATRATGVTEYARPGRGGGRYLAAMQPLTGTPWILVVELSLDRALAPATNFLRRIGAVAVLFLAVGTVGAWLADRRIAVPALRRGEAALRESVERFRQIAENIREAFFVVDLDTKQTIYVSPAWAEIWRRPQREAYELPGVWIETLHPDDRARLQASRQLVATGETSTDTFRVVRPDGAVRWVRERTFPVKNDAGQVYRLVGLAEDITELKQTEQQLQQAQKMEAVGRLAGGVAHDFNNLLTVIASYSQLVLEDLPVGDPRRADLEEVQKAAHSASGLTRQLLAFSRQQVLAPMVLDLNEVVASAGKMLKRLIGEDIDLVTSLQEDIGAVKVDAGQMEQVLMNLAVNARDAMPDGGKLTIETKGVELEAEETQLHRSMPAGSYVMIAMTDSGTGMREEVREHIFEPFFTTKAAGKGTGLGLATVYGIVQQSDGFIWCYSEIGQGTTFKIYLPRVVEAVSAPAAPASGRSLRGNETILIAEDAPSVRDVAHQVLVRHGYHVLLAADGRAALELAQTHTGNIHMLLTDVIMPEMSGRQLADRLVKARPTVKILFCSGYTDDAIIRHGMLEPGLNYLQKPFTPESLARKVRDVLDA
jgi:PAS domain S-box-containing protein